MKAAIRKRVENLEQLYVPPTSEFADQMLYAALEAIDAESLELLIRFTTRGGGFASAPAEEQKAVQRYSELYQAEAMRISGRSWPALVRARMVYRTGTLRVMGTSADEK